MVFGDADREEISIEPRNTECLRRLVFLVEGHRVVPTLGER